MSARTVRLHRLLRADPEHLYRAFLDADAMSKWLPPYGFTCKVHLLDAKVGGTFRMSFTNFTTRNGHSFGGAYQQLVPKELFAMRKGSTTRICLARWKPPSLSVAFRAALS